MNEQKQEWFKSIIEDDNEFNKSLNLNYLLEDSLYYPCSGHDPTPINRFAGDVDSFIYADLAEKSKDHLKWIKLGLPREIYDSVPDNRYSLVKKRKIKWSEIIPNNWVPTINPIRSDGNYDQLKGWQEELAAPRYVYWSIWKINDIEDQEKEKSKYFSLLYFGGCEMNAVYQALYNRHNVVPKILTIINPGMGFWDCKYIDNKYITHSFFNRVLEANLKGFPPYLYTDRYESISFKNRYEKILDEKSDYYELFMLKKYNNE